MGSNSRCVSGCCAWRSVGSTDHALQELLMDRFDVVMVISALMLLLMLVNEWLGNT